MNSGLTCLVLGGSGFLGQCLCKRLVGEGFRVRSVSRLGSPAGPRESWWSDVEWVAAPIGSEGSIQAIRSSDFIFHLASTTVPSTSNLNIAFDLESNVVATIRILEKAVSEKVRRVIFVSSGGTVYGVPDRNPIGEDQPTNPICSYGVQKLTIEKYLQLFHSMAGLDSIILRVSNIYGESQNANGPIGAVAHFVDRALNGTPIEIWGDGTTTRDYVHVDDVVNALVASLSHQGTARLFNIGTGRGVSLNQLVELVRVRTKTGCSIEYKAARGFDVQTNVLNVSRARHELSWVPTITLEAGLDRMVKRASAISAEIA
jgi:UDP-glucose 4-epimerase